MKKNKLAAKLCILCMLLTMLIPVQTFGADVAVDRLAGNDRYETGAKIAQAGWTTAENVVIAAGSNQNLVDALAIAPLAKLKNAPILLTEGGKLNAKAKAEIERLGATNAYIASGGGVITQALKDELAQMGLSVVSLGGQDRFETAANIANEILKLQTSDTVVVTTAYANADALSVASLAAAKGWPILLSGKDSLPASAVALINGGSVSKSYIIGGTGAVGGAVASSLPGAVRLGGSDRFATNMEILKHFANDFDYSKGLFVANGYDNHLVDSLAASSYIAGAPLLLTGDSSLSSALKEWLNDKNILKVTLLGGSSVVSQGIFDQIVAALGTSAGGGGGGGGGGGKPTTQPDVKLTSASDLVNFVSAVLNNDDDYEGKTIELSGDIQLDENTNTILKNMFLGLATGEFKFLGVLDGKGYSIKGANISIVSSEIDQVKTTLSSNKSDAIDNMSAMLSQGAMIKDLNLEEPELIVNEETLQTKEQVDTALNTFYETLDEEFEVPGLTKTILKRVYSSVSITLDGKKFNI